MNKRFIISLLILFLLFIGQASASYLQVENGTTVQFSNITEFTCSVNPCYINVTLSSNISGTFQYGFQAKYVTAAPNVQLMKDNIKLGTNFYANSSSYVQYNETITNFTNSTQLNLKISGIGQSKVKEFRLSYDTTGYNISTSGNVTTLERINWTNSTNSVYLGGAFNPQTINQFYANITSLSTRSDPYQINTSGLVGWWHFDDNLTDVSGMNNNATVADNGTLSTAKATWTTSGKYGGGLYLNGTPATSTDDGYINTSTINDGNIRINVSKGFTAILWTNITNNSRYNAMMGQTTNSGIAAPFDTWVLQGGSDVYFYVGNGTTENAISISSAVTFGVWQQWGFTFNPLLSNEVMIYKNGSLVSSTTFPTQGIAWGDYPLRIGTRGDLFTKMLGTIDEPYLYNDVLSASEMANAFNNSYPTDNLIFHYDLNESSGVIAHDVQVPSYSNAKFNNATVIDVDGILHKRILNSNSLKINTSITVDLWFKLNSISGYQELIEKGDAGSNRDYFIRTDGDELSYGYWNGTAWQFITTTNANLTTGIWYYFTISDVIGDGSEVSTFLKGQTLSYVWSAGNGASVNTLSNNNIHIGRLYDNTERLNGQIDELRIYNRTKNFTEHQQDYSTRLEQLKVKNDQSSTWSSYWNHSDNNSIIIPYNAGVLLSYVNISLPSFIIQNGVTIYEYLNSTLFKIDVVIDGLQIPLDVNYVFPTRLNTTETRNQNYTQIKINSTVPLENATLFWRNHYDTNYNVPYSVYSMNETNSTSWELTLSNLWDDEYYYYVSANSSSQQYVLPTKYVRIDLQFVSRTMDGINVPNIYLWRNNSDSSIYRSVVETDGNNVSLDETDHIVPGWTRVEQEYHVWTDTPYSGWPYNNVLIYNCYNSTSGYRDDNITCLSGETQEYFGRISEVYNVHSVPVWRYSNGAGKYATFVDRSTIPDGYTQNKFLGWSIPGLTHEDDMIYINNSKIKVGINKKHGGAIEYLSILGGENLVNMWDTGRGIQTSYWDASTTPWYSVSRPIKWGWEPVLEGSVYNEPSIVLSYSNTSTSFTALVNMTNFFTDYGNQYTDMQTEVNYSFDGENPVLITSFKYIHYGNHTHTAPMHEIPAMAMIGKLNRSWYRNETTLFQQYPLYGAGKYCSDGGSWGCVWTGIFNSSDFGVGLWNSKRPNMLTQNFTYGIGGQFGIPAMYLGSQPAFSVLPYGQTGLEPSPWYPGGDTNVVSYTGINYARIGIGDRTSLDAYFTSLEFGIDYDPSVPINQTVNNIDYIYIRVNTTDLGQIQSSILNWTNSSGVFNVTMTVDILKEYAFVNMTNLTLYNYSYYVYSNATTGVITSTATVWTNLIDTIPPISITNLQNTTGTTYINWTWTDPADIDFDHVEVYLNGTFNTNVSKGIQYYLNSSLQPNTWYELGTHTVDTVGNINQTWVNQTTKTDIAEFIPPTPISLSVTKGNFFANYTWSAGLGNTTNSYNVTLINNSITYYINGSAQTWINSSNLSASQWSNISVYSYNSSGTGTLNTTPASLNTQMNGTPNITSWANTYTNNNTLSFTVPQNTNVTFNATANQTLTTCSWVGATQINCTADTFAYKLFDTAGTKYVNLSGSNANGSTLNSVNWTIEVTALPPSTFIPPTPIWVSNTTGSTWVNHSWQAGSGNYTDSYNVSQNGSWYNGTATYYNASVGAGNWSNITIWAYNNSGLLSASSISNNSKTETATQTYTPPTPTISTVTTGNFWKNISWAPGAGNITNSYNVSVNGTWTNGTTSTYMNNTTSPHGYLNYTIYAYNSSGVLSTTALTNNTQMSNNAPTISLDNKTIDEGTSLEIQINSTDADSDTLSYSINRSDLFTDFSTVTGSGNWSSNYSSSGIYYIDAGVNDGNVSRNYTFTITVNNVPLSIISTTPSSNPTITLGDPQVFEADTNRTANYTWYLNGSSIQTNSSLTTANYTNLTGLIGIHNITLIVSDGIDTNSTTWLWTVTALPVYSISGYVFDNSNNILQAVTVFNGTNTSDTNSLGYYIITGMVNGSHNLTFNKTGFTNSYLNATITGANVVNQNKTIWDNSSPTQTILTQGTVGLTTINISFTSTDINLYGYQVYRNGTIISNTTNTYYNDTGLTKNTSYSYIVRANDTYNNWGVNSTPLNITTNDTYSISGYVSNSTTALTGSNVSYSNGSNLTNSYGYYIIQNIANGTYTFTASLSGYDNNATSITINGSSLTNQNFTLTLTTPPPAAPPSGGGGGSTTVTPKPTVIVIDIKDSNNNPPLLNIFATTTGATITLQNEGAAPQEYIINWNLKDVFGRIIDSGIESKKVNNSEIFEIPITITQKKIYILEVVAQYGVYQSKTAKVFVNENPFSIEAIMTVAITFIVLIVSIISLYYIRHMKRKARRF